MNHTTKKSKSLLALLLSGTMVLSLWTPASVEATGAKHTKRRGCLYKPQCGRLRAGD